MYIFLYGLTFNIGSGPVVLCDTPVITAGYT